MTRLAILVLAGLLSGCIVAPPPGPCWHCHPHGWGPGPHGGGFGPGRH